MGYILMLLFSVIDKEKKDSTNYIIAKYILNNLGNSRDISVSSISAGCNISKATVSRFCKTLGLEDFLDLQILIRGYNPLTSQKFNYDSQSYESDDYVEVVENKINEFKKSIDLNTISEIVQDLSNYKKISLLGLMQSGHILMNLQNDLASLGNFVNCTTEIVGIRDTLMNATSDELILVFSARGYFFDIVFPRIKTKYNTSHPKIYFVTSNTSESTPNYIYKTIHLDTNYNYSSSTLLYQLYANMIALQYYQQIVQTEDISE